MIDMTPKDLFFGKEFLHRRRRLQVDALKMKIVLLAQTSVDDDERVEWEQLYQDIEKLSRKAEYRLRRRKLTEEELQKYLLEIENRALNIPKGKTKFDPLSRTKISKG